MYMANKSINISKQYEPNDIVFSKVLPPVVVVNVAKRWHKLEYAPSNLTPHVMLQRINVPVTKNTRQLLRIDSAGSK